MRPRYGAGIRVSVLSDATRSTCMASVSVSSNQGTGEMPSTAPILFDAADTSSFTLSGQRENIDRVGVDSGSENERIERLEGLSAREASLDIVPPFDLITFIGLPAKKHDPAFPHGRKIDKSLPIILQLDSKAFQFLRVQR